MEAQSDADVKNSVAQAIQPIRMEGNQESGLTIVNK
jgi:hypothetical protein